MVDELEEQLSCDISCCSLCPLAAEKVYHSPSIEKHVDTVLLLEAPNVRSCIDLNPWKATGANFLSKALQHAAGFDLTRYHITFITKCVPRLNGFAPPKRQRRDWASVCANRYLHQELKAIAPHRILIFGEIAAKVCFPNIASTWDELTECKMYLEPLGIESHVFESLSRLQKQGITGTEGDRFLSKLHQILGGRLSRPDAATELNLFELI